MFRLIFPIIFPSWRFFSSIGPSPRIDVGFVVEEDSFPSEWYPFRPIPQRLTFTQCVVRLFHNPHWNEQLFINTCAERLFEGGDEFYLNEIAGRLLVAINHNEVAVPVEARFMVFRIRAIYSEDTPANQIGRVVEQVFFQSLAYALTQVEMNL